MHRLVLVVQEEVDGLRLRSKRKIEKPKNVISKAENIKNICDERGFISISMKNDCKTIYGDGVEKIQY